MHTLQNILLWYLLFFTLSRIYNFAYGVCKQMVVLPVFLCRAYWPENGQTPMDKQK